MINQLVAGSFVLVLCFVVHSAAIVLAITPLRRIGIMLGPARPLATAFAVTLMALGVIVFAHTLEVWIWALLLLARGAFGDVEAAVYFALSTYTTLGYGDVLVGEEHRIFAAMAAVNGLVVFGLSAAFLVEVMTRMLRNRLAI